MREKDKAIFGKFRHANVVILMTFQMKHQSRLENLGKVLHMGE